MDPLDILTNKENVIPYFQPIFSADEQEVMGYEVLGRYSVNDDIHSLGSFFQDDSIPDEYRNEIDDYLQSKAIEKVLSLENEDFLIFLNRNANILMNDGGESFLALLTSYQEKGLSLNRIVIEITEHQYTGDLERLSHVLTYYQTYGIQIALDNVGKGGSNLDRLRLLSPDILKVDLNILKQTNDSFAYQDVLQSLSLLARKIGATLLYEDIESPFQLQYAWKHDGRYYQGFYLGKPTESFIDKSISKEKMRAEFHRFVVHEKRKLQGQYEITERLNKMLVEVQAKFQNNNFEQIAYQAAEVLDECSFRVYICDEDGIQLSPNIVKMENNVWTKQQQYIGKNWSWRPYFLENISRMNYVQKGILSDLYSDIETGENIRTFSYPVGSKYYIFVDLPYEYIYQNDALL